jgi:hypothetical protein
VGLPTKQIPAVAPRIKEHGHPTIGLGAGLLHEGHACRPHCLVGQVEILNPKKEGDSTSGLVADSVDLSIAVCTSKQ